MINENGHEIVFDGLSPHNGEYWYKCVKCGKSDWIASYGTINQLSFYDQPCCLSDQTTVK